MFAQMSSVKESPGTLSALVIPRKLSVPDDRREG